MQNFIKIGAGVWISLGLHIPTDICTLWEEAVGFATIAWGWC